MTQIKSEKAKNYLNKKGYTMYGEPVICLTSATKAVIFAETEAEERHAKEMQELRDKAVEQLSIATGISRTEVSQILDALPTEKLNGK